MKINDKYLIKNVSKELPSLEAALVAAQLSGTGDAIATYETKLARVFGSTKALAQSSGSAALHTALHCLGVKDGDEVLIPAIAPIPTILPILTAHALPVVVDIAEDGLGFDIEDMKRKISSRTKAAILVPLWGYPIDYAPTLKLLNECNIPLIEDAAQAHGAKIGDKFIGTFGKVGCFSTHDRKLVSTGEGGYILTDDEQLYERMKRFSQLGYMDGETYGVNYKLSALQAALGTYRLDQLESQVAQRTKNVELVLKKLAKTNIKAMPVVEQGRPNYYSLVLMLPWDKETNYRFIEKVNGLGVDSDIIKYRFRAIYQRPMFEVLATPAPHTEQLLERMTTVPVHPGLGTKELTYLANALESTYQEFAHAARKSR